MPIVNMELDKQCYNLPKICTSDQKQEMLKLLAEDFSEKTRILTVPKGTTVWETLRSAYVTKPWQDTDPVVDAIQIELRYFFGVVMGYSPELDILVYWSQT